MNDDEWIIVKKGSSKKKDSEKIVEILKKYERKLSDGYKYYACHRQNCHEYDSRLVDGEWKDFTKKCVVVDEVLLKLANEILASLK